MKLNGQKILITGGASGIGLGLTERFLKEKNEVIVCGRRKDILDQLKVRFPEVTLKVCDLSLESERVSLGQWVQKEHSDLSVLINNAGVQHWIKWSDEDFFTRAKNEIETNVLAPIHLSQIFSKLGSLTTIINVTSGLAFTPLVKVPVYSATKAMLRSFTLSLRQMLKEKNIEVIELIPPALNTDLGGKGLHDDAPAVSLFVESVFTQLAEGKTEITFGFSDNMIKAGPDQLKAMFERMNGN